MTKIVRTKIGLLARPCFMLLVLAACFPNGEPLRVYFNVMTANLYQGARNDPGLDRIACYISNADIVFLQEVEKGTSGRGGVDQAKELAQKSGLTSYRFAKRKDFDGGEGGIAILSRYPLSEVAIHAVPDAVYYQESTVIIQAVVTFFSQRITLFATHYPAGVSDPQLARQLREKTTDFALNLIAGVQGPIIFGGDLNATSDKVEVIRLTSQLTDAWNAAPQDRDHCGGGNDRIDYLLFRGPYVVRQYEAPCWPLNETYLPKYEKPNCALSGADLSDHPFVLVKYEIVGN